MLMVASVEAMMMNMMVMKRGEMSRAVNCSGHCNHHGIVDGDVDDADDDDEAGQDAAGG